MSFQIKFHPGTRKDLRRITSKAREEILFKILPEFSENSFIGIPLTGPLRGYYKYRVFLYGVWYRIAYTIDHAHKEITIIAIGPRGSFYERLKHRIHR